MESYWPSRYRFLSVQNSMNLKQLACYIQMSQTFNKLCIPTSCYTVLQEVLLKKNKVHFQLRVEYTLCISELLSSHLSIIYYHGISCTALNVVQGHLHFSFLLLLTHKLCIKYQIVISKAHFATFKGILVHNGAY